MNKIVLRIADLRKNTAGAGRAHWGVISNGQQVGNRSQYAGYNHSSNTVRLF